jgi:phytoene desaturase
MSANDPVIVIGAGIGGLAAAVRARAMGHRVVILEATSQAGGRASVFKKDGFTFDAGPTVITAPYLIDELFSLVGRDRRDYIELLPVDPFYRVSFTDGTHFDYVGDEARLLEQIREFNPADVEGYKRLAAHAKRIFDIGYLKLADAPFDRLSDMLRVVPDMLMLENYRTVYGLVSKYIQDERLRQVFTFQPLLIGGNPFDASSIYLLIHWLEREWGVWFAKGGTTAMIAGLVRLLEDIGVELRLDTPVEEIVVRDGRAVAVRTAGGETLAARYVVSNGDPAFTYGKLLAPEHRRVNTDRRVARVRPSMGLFVAYFGTKTQYTNLAHHEIVLGPRYRGLLTDIFHNKVLADDFSLYLHAPGRTDSSLAPEGKDGFYVLSPVPNNLSGINWEETGPKYLERILDVLEERKMPGLRENLETSFFVTPDYFEKNLRTVAGAGFCAEPTLTQSAWFRWHNRSEDIEGLFLVGAGTHPGAGVPGVLCSAKVVEKLLPAPAPHEVVPVPGAEHAAAAK